MQETLNKCGGRSANQQKHDRQDTRNYTADTVIPDQGNNDSGGNCACVQVRYCTEQRDAETCDEREYRTEKEYTALAERSDKGCFSVFPVIECMQEPGQRQHSKQEKQDPQSGFVNRGILEYSQCLIIQTLARSFFIDEKRNLIQGISEKRKGQR